jgi:hypothetical protein
MDLLRAATDYVDAVRKHLEERLDRVAHEMAELRRAIDDLDLRVRYLEGPE